jgi:F0F1-type ATP synthase assembly protein I
MASDKAKELAAKQKADVKAAKLAKKNSTDPRDWPWYKQIWQTYKVTAEVDKQLNLLLAAAFVGVLVLSVVVGVFAGSWWMWLILGVVGGLTAALWVLLDRAKKATFIRYAGQPGSAEVALSMLDKKKWFYEPAIAATKQLDVVHRAVGPGGIVLVGEGSAARVKSLLTSETRKHEQVAYGVVVTTIVMGDGEGQVPLAKLADTIKKLPKKLEASQVTDVKARLRALDAVRPKVPMPRGPMPSMKGVNRAMRGR